MSVPLCCRMTRAFDGSGSSAATENMIDVKHRNTTGCRRHENNPRLGRAEDGLPAASD